MSVRRRQGRGRMSRPPARNHSHGAQPRPERSRALSRHDCLLERLSALFRAERYPEMLDALEMETFWPYKRSAAKALAAMGKKT